MKKILSIMFVALMLVSCMTVTAFASEVGETVTVSFKTSGNPGFAYYGAKINYDHDALTLVEINAGELSEKGYFHGNASSGIVGFAAGSQNITGDGVIFTATFKINNSAKAGNSYEVTVTLDTKSTGNADMKAVEFEIKGGTITVHCNHKWDAGKVTKEATCTEKGVKTFTCTECGETKTEEIAATGHKWDAGKVTKEATCTEDGVKTFTCTECGETKTEEIAATGHKWDAGKVTKEATCTEDGVKTFTCTECGETKTEKIAATGHHYDENGNCACGAKDPNHKSDDDLDDVPQTGDITVSLMSCVVAVVAMFGTAVVVTKRKLFR